MSRVIAPRPIRSLIVATLLAAAVVLLAPAAVAHDLLIDSSPSDGEVLAEPPEAVVLTFNNPPLNVGSAVTVESDDGTQVAEGEGEAAGNDVRLALESPLEAGTYDVVWRVASSDGHPIEGNLEFTVAASIPGPTSGATSSPTVAAAPASTASATPATAESAAQSTDVADQDGLAGLPMWAKVVISLAAIGAVAGLIVIVARRLRSGN